MLTHFVQPPLPPATRAPYTGPSGVLSIVHELSPEMILLGHVWFFPKIPISVLDFVVKRGKLHSSLQGVYIPLTLWAQTLSDDTAVGSY